MTEPTGMAAPLPPQVAEKFEVTVMFTCDISVTEADVIQAFLRAVHTKEFWLPGHCQVYAKALPPATLMTRRHFNTIP